MTAEVIPIPTELMVSDLYRRYCAALNDVHMYGAPHHIRIADHWFRQFYEAYSRWCLLTEKKDAA